MRNAIPLAIAYARNVHAIENHSFQRWLQEKVEREDLIWWARRPEERELLEDQEEVHREGMLERAKHLLNSLVP